VVIAENVLGLLHGKAKGYAREIVREFLGAGYSCQVFVLNAACMGVPQARRRVFFIGQRLGLPPLRLSFSEKPIPFSEIDEGDVSGSPMLSEFYFNLWLKCKAGDVFKKAIGGTSHFSPHKVHPNKPLPTTVSLNWHHHHKYPRLLTDTEIIAGQTFPIDYDFLTTSPAYLCGLSVPPFMMQRVAFEVGRQWFDGGDNKEGN
jgi:DNA (cytosine-5)-methyltransferase 1